MPASLYKTNGHKEIGKTVFVLFFFFSLENVLGCMRSHAIMGISFCYESY